MQFLSTYAHETNSTLTKTSIQRVSRGYRIDKLGRKNYGIMLDDGWTNVFPSDSDKKCYQGEYVYVSASGQIAPADEIEKALEEIDQW